MGPVAWLASIAALLVGATVTAFAWALWRALRLPTEHPGAFLARPRPRGPVAVCCGDSLTHGHVGYDWVGALRRRFPEWHLVNAGVNGDLAWNLARRLDAVVACRPDAVTLLIGSNDAMGAHHPRIAAMQMVQKGLPRIPDICWYEEGLREVLARLTKETGARITLVTLPWVGEDAEASVSGVVDAHNDVILAVAAEHSLPVLPLHDRMGALLEDRSAPALPYEVGPVRRWRMVRAILFHYLLGYKWDRIGDRLGLLTQCDLVHLNERSGRILEELAAGFLAQRT
jgi:lysophospholipase L1-like esterase